jgi:superfamily II DNA/RNA helicase
MLDMGFEPQIRKVVEQIRVSEMGQCAAVLYIPELFYSLIDKH